MDIQAIRSSKIWQLSALKLEKSAISKVQKYIFCHFKNGKKLIFAQEKSLKLPKIAIFGLFSSVKIDFFAILEIAENVFLYF